MRLMFPHRLFFLSEAILKNKLFPSENCYVLLVSANTQHQWTALFTQPRKGGQPKKHY